MPARPPGARRIAGTDLYALTRTPGDIERIVYTADGTNLGTVLRRSRRRNLAPGWTIGVNGDRYDTLADVATTLAATKAAHP